MPRNKKQTRKGRNGPNKKLVAATGRTGYEEIIKVSGTVTVTATTGGTTFQGITGPGAGGGSWFTPYSSGTNYATLSQWGDFRLSKVVVQPVATVVGSTADAVMCIAATDSTGYDAINGGTASGAWNSIRSRQTSRLCALTNAKAQGPKWTFKPDELNNRLWFPQAALSLSTFTGASAPSPGTYWGVLFSAYSATSSTVTLMIDWYFNVREPMLSGVLLGTETPEVRRRLEKLGDQMTPWVAKEPPDPKLRSASVGACTRSSERGTG
jgi:hypothetical protein